jgi:exosortase/archaeosortase family protein
MQAQSSKSDGAVAGLVVRFAAYFAVFSALILFLDSRGLLRWLQDVTAIASDAGVRMLGIGTVRNGTLIHLSQRVLAIDLACTAVFIMALYAALVLAYPVSARDRLVGIVVGIAIISVGNVLRIVAAAVVAQTAPPLFTFFHDYLFQVGMVLLTVAAWAAWLLYLKRHA